MQRTGLGSEGVGGTEHLSAGLDGIKTLPDHTDDGAGKHCRCQLERITQS
jgi:hypothetical protein